ncbi:uncharacterized protein LOC129913310 [Episyrphus balteatus]|uniref:uncharacterized protein LOC129913310 n=1 Tax=Episyrphus balteatus TaxID=286459 RepID=UPI00248550B0|nr:uncharacterized protein LOC129913310 [Episyrphus balteatus]
MEQKPSFFKIVATKENGKYLLSAVPRSWEENGSLMWPPRKLKDKAIKNLWDPPGTAAEGWTQHKCQVKRSYIPTYGEALKEIRAMSDMSDTTDCEGSSSCRSFLPIKTAHVRKPGPKSKNPDDERFNFNEYQPTAVTSSNKNNKPNSQDQFENDENDENQCLSEEKGCDLAVKEIPNATAKFQLEGTIASLVNEVCKLQIRMEHCITLQEQIFQKVNGTCGVSDPVDAVFAPIENLKDLQAFEGNLANKDFQENMLRKFSSICGPKSGQRGDNVCYRVVDSLFSRKLFTLVSWSGVSRTKKNESFSRFTNTFHFFLNLIKKSDSTYTEAELKDFFQKIINNSKRRYESTLSDTSKRMSSSKHYVPKQKILKKSSGEDVESEPMDKKRSGEDVESEAMDIEVEQNLEVLSDEILIDSIISYESDEAE